MGIEYLEYLFGGFIYWLSPAFRAKKQKEWAEKSDMHKIYEVGMWIAIPFITLLLIVALVASNKTG